MPNKILIRTAWRYLTRHPWQTSLMVLGITLGVAVAVAIDLANESASRAFDISTESITGRATHFIDAGLNGVDDRLYVNLRRQGFQAAIAPVITFYVSSSDLGGGLMQFLAVDPFAEGPFRDYFVSMTSENGQILGDLRDFLTRPAAVLISESNAERYGINLGDSITLDFDGSKVSVEVVGIILSRDLINNQALDNLILSDIATAQEITDRAGVIDRIDVLVPENDQERIVQQIRQLLPENYRIESVDSRTGTVAQMTDAFRVNLTALSLLALVVGLFLIYNTATFSVVQRRIFFGLLRSLGVTRREVFLLVIGEAFIVGITASILGLFLGIFLGQGAVKLVTRTINDLFFVVSVQGVQIPISSLLKGGVLGILATTLAAAPPAWEAASTPPNTALTRSNLERKARFAVQAAAVIGIGVCLLGIVLLILPTKSLVVGFLGTFAIVIGFAMLSPVATIGFSMLCVPIFGMFWGTIGRMSARSVINSLSRTSIAVSALMVAVSVTIGVSLMISSFRSTVEIWLEQVLQGDIYISAPNIIASQPSLPVKPEIIQVLEKWPGIEQIFTLRAVTVDSPNGPVLVNASSNLNVDKDRLFHKLYVPGEQVSTLMQDGGVVISEPLANRLGIGEQGGSIELYSDQGTISFPILGVYYDYASTSGIVLMAQSLYHQYWDDETVTAISVNLLNPENLDDTSKNMKDDLSNIQSLSVRSNHTLRHEALTIFDRTFTITQALQLLAVIVAFVGILSSLLSLELERQREIGILRAVGLTKRQLWNVIMVETGLLGSTAGLLALPTGYVLAYILIFIINRRSFGWTLQMHVISEPFIQAFFLALLAAMLAGVYPAWRMSRMVPSDAVRYEV